MARKYYYSAIVRNSYLGVEKELKAQTQYELALKVNEQKMKWAEQERRQRERARIESLKEQAEFDTIEAKEKIESYKTILSSTLKINDKLDWESLKDKKPFKKFKFEDEQPTLEKINAKLNVPKENKIIEFILKSKKDLRLQKEAEAQRLYELRLKEYEENKEKAKADYEKQKEEYLNKQKAQHDEIENFKQNFEQGHGEAIEKYVCLVLERSRYPDGLERNYQVQYEPISGTIIVEYELLSPFAIPRITGYKYISTRKVIEKVEMKQKEFDVFYEDILYQICLRSIHEIFEAVYIDDVKSVVFNGWVSGVDTSTGNDFHSCIMSCQAQKDEFKTYNLERVNPKETFKKMKGISAGPLAHLAPVKPILDIKREDKRFIESREVLAVLNASTNLASIDWADFEHLVRELFSKIFSAYGGEVKVTRASRDGGVDAIAFDPDPIRGGKFVIQAKRYNNVVPVSAARDLYGTMISEGATKGILVTTSYYGNDTREFVKDKPISLIDGANLVYLFNEYGYNVTISLNGKD